MNLLANLERAKGIEPSYAAWEAAVLPLNYARTVSALRMILFGKPVTAFPDHALLISRDCARRQARFAPSAPL